MLTNKVYGQKKTMGQQCKSFPIFKSINDKSSLLALKPGYSMSPGPQQIFERQFMVKNLTIRNQYAEVTWRGAVDLRKLKVPLESLIDLGPTHIEVYPDQRVKPLAGTELNKICFVTFKNLKKISNRNLRKICDGNGCELLQVDRSNKNFTVQIPHFTIYKFTDEAKDDSESEQKQEKGNLAKGLKQKNELQLSQEQQFQKQTHLSEHKSLNSKYQPTQQFLDRISNHNRSHGHMMSDERMRGSQITSVINGVITSASKQKNSQSALFSLPQEVDRSEFTIVEKILQNQNQVNLSIISPETPFHVKSVLSLNAICFQFQKVKFEFVKTSTKIQFAPISRSPDNHYQLKYLGNWFEWVINESVSSLVLPQNHIIRALCLRKGAEIAEKLLDFKRNGDAQFLSKIEDESFRSVQTVDALCQELRTIENGEMKLFNDLEWIVKLGVFIWYFLIGVNKTSGIQQSIQDILLQNTDKQYPFQLERQILLTFMNIPLPLKRKGLESDKNLPIEWLISNCNNEQEKHLNNGSSYEQYRYELASRICHQFADSYIALQIVTNDQYLQQNHRNKILKSFIKSFPLQAMRIPIDDWREYSHLVYEYRGMSLFGQGKYFKALQCFSLCRNLSSDAQVVIKQIACVEEILCGFHRKTLQKSKRLLQKLETKVLQDELLFMSLILGEQQIDQKKARKVINFCYKIPQQGLRKRMLQSIFKIMISSPTMIVHLRKDAQLQGFIDEIYKDPSYKLQLKLVKLET